MKYLLVLPAILIGIALLGASAAPKGSVWLGSGIVSPSDTAVYLSYLRQGADGHLLLSNLYAIEPNRPRFDLVWSTLGLIARIGVPIIVVDELARALFCVILILAIGWAARRTFPSRRDADLATVLAFAGIGSGWLYSIALRAVNGWTPTTIAAPDIASEFAIGPTLFGGVHIILAIALLVTALRLIWNGFMTGSRRDLLLGSLAGSALIAFHPYATPLLGLFTIATTLLTPSTKRRLANFFLVAIILTPPVLYYAWLLIDPVFGAHHLSENILPLASPIAWITTLLPFFIAGIWMWRKRLHIAIDWPLVWIGCVLILLLFLPVPWKRKLAEGLLIPIIFLTMPAWIAVRDWVRKIRPTSMQIPLIVALLLAAWLGPLHLLLSQLTWWQDPTAAPFFFTSTDLVAATHHLRETTTEHDILLADSFWTNTWLPSQTGRRVMIGHDQETPVFATKDTLFHTLLDTTSSTQAQTILSETGVTRFITTTQKHRDQFAVLLDSVWTVDATFSDVTIWKYVDQR